MNTNIGAVAASLLTLATPLAAGSAPTDPVIVKVMASVPGGSSETGRIGMVTVAFENQVDETANLVVLRISAGGTDTVINDVGTFSKGVWIRHDYRIGGVAGDASAQVLGVRFVDGSTWKNQTPAVQPRRQAGSEITEPQPSI